jgi:glycosyltransferase involved in cell wall biosynthesis
MIREPSAVHPLITIGITCFNAHETIDRAVKSALAQEWPNLEVLVVDDCSRDDSRARVERAAAAHTRLRLIKHAENLGPGAARQTLLDHAAGEFLAFFDDDDESAPGRVAAQVGRITEYEERAGTRLIACYASGERRYPNGYRLVVDAIGSAPRVPAGPQVADYLLFNRRARGVCYGGGTPSCALMARVDTFRAVGGFDPAFRRSEDVDFAVRLALLGGHFVGCPERLYVQYATQAPDKNAARNFDAEMRLLEKHRAYLEGRRRYHFARDWFTVRFHHFNHERARMLAALARAWIGHPILVTRQMLTTVPARIRHERRMSKEAR